jgi:hypothetical protein
VSCLELGVCIAVRPRFLCIYFLAGSHRRVEGANHHRRAIDRIPNASYKRSVVVDPCQQSSDLKFDTYAALVAVVLTVPFWRLYKLTAVSARPEDVTRDSTRAGKGWALRKRDVAALPAFVHAAATRRRRRSNARCASRRRMTGRGAAYSPWAATGSTSSASTGGSGPTPLARSAAPRPSASRTRWRPSTRVGLHRRSLWCKQGRGLPIFMLTTMSFCNFHRKIVFIDEILEQLINQ